MAKVDNRPISRGKRQSNSLYLTDLSRDPTNATSSNLKKTSTNPVQQNVQPVVLSDEELDPPKNYLKPHEVKVRLYLRECEKLKVIPVSAFVRHPTKNALKLRHYNIGPNGARALAAALLLDTEITYLDIEGNSITSVGLASIRVALTENIKISNLNIADNKLGSRGAELIGKMMTNNFCIEVLNVGHNGFRDHDAPIFARIIKDNHKLKELGLSGNEFEDIAGTVLGNALASNETLERLDISWNNIRKKGAAEFAQGIKENVGLKKLNASFNGFGTEGTAFMAQALSTNRTLLELDLSKNRITDIDVKIFSSQLSQNETLEVLKIGDNLMTPLGAMDILRAAIKCETLSLRLIDFGSTSVDKGFLTLLDELKTLKDVTVLYGKVQNVYADKEMMPEPEIPVLDDVDDSATVLDGDDNLVSERSEKEKGKTYVVDSQDSETKNKDDGDDDEDNSGDNSGEKKEKSDKENDDDGIDHDEEKLDDEVKAITGKAARPKQEAIVTERASVGTVTPDI